MYWTMLRRELIGRRKQTIVVAAGLAIAIALVIVVSSLSAGIRQAQSEALEGVYGVGTDLTLTGAAAEPDEGGGPRFDFAEGAGETADGTTKLASSRLSTSGRRGTLEASAVASIAGLDGVAAATGTLSLTNSTFSGEMPDMSKASGSAESAGAGSGAAGAPGSGDGGGPGGPSSFGIDSFSVMGVDPAAAEVGPLSSIDVSDGRALAASDAGALVAVVDATYASTAELAVGDTIDVGGSDVEVVGIVTSTSAEADSAANVFLPLDTARTLAGVEDVVSTIYVSAENAGDIDAVQAEISAEFEDATVSSQADLAAQVSGSLSSASSLIATLGTWLSIIVLIVALAIAMLLTSSGVTRRTRELGTLKAIGWSNGRLVRQLAGESTAQALIGGVVGLALGLGAIGVFNLISPTLQLGGGSSGSRGGSGAPGGAAGGSMPEGASMPDGGGMGGAGMPGSGASSSLTEVVLHAPVTLWVVLAAVLLSLLGGLLAGSLASWRVARLSPAAALRTVA